MAGKKRALLAKSDGWLLSCLHVHTTEAKVPPLLPSLVAKSNSGTHMTDRENRLPPCAVAHSHMYT